jgi:hypothetical protein
VFSKGLNSSESNVEKKIEMKKSTYLDGFIEENTSNIVTNWDGSGITRIKEKLEEINKRLSILYKRPIDSSKYLAEVKKLEIGKAKLEEAIRSDNAKFWKGLLWLLCLIISIFAGAVLFGCFLFTKHYIQAILTGILGIILFIASQTLADTDDNDKLWTWIPIILAVIEPIGIVILCGSGGLIGIPLLIGGMFMTLIEALPVIAAIAAAMMFFGL